MRPGTGKTPGRKQTKMPYKGMNSLDIPQVPTGAKLAEAPPPPSNGLLQKLINTHRTIIDAASKQVVFSPPWLSLDDAPVLSAGTITMIQGSFGSHKSRLAESLCSIILSKAPTTTDLKFKKYGLGSGYYLAYIDTERGISEAFPAAVQRIRERAGYDAQTDEGHFYPLSIKTIPRSERLQAVQMWVQYVRGIMTDRGVPDWNLLLVLDVVSDCISDFNNVTESLLLFDYLNTLCENYRVCVLGVLHQNPGTDKMRGHAGTEAANKADTVLQIGYDGPDETELIKLRFLKSRNAQRPQPIYLKFSSEQRALILADADTVELHLQERRKTKDTDLLMDLIKTMSDEVSELTQKAVVERATNALGWSKNTVISKLDKLLGMDIYDKSGALCTLEKLSIPGKPTMLILAPKTTDEPTQPNQPPI